MFTGIVQEIGTVTKAEDLGDAARLEVSAPRLGETITKGSSIAVNGCCLTVLSSAGGVFSTLVMEDTLQATNLGLLTEGSRVNLETPLALHTPLGGHLVQGFIDDVTELVARRSTDHFDTLRFTVPERFSTHLVRKGPVALDGISLTVSERGEHWFEVSLIPLTLGNTIFGDLAVGTRVNLEIDLFAKYIDAIVAMRQGHAQRESPAMTPHG
ncbi:riboflavin synthase [Corynebacterium mendelii]|uniref:Riboflavin synthase n=1 Tax=Corynebacterium mendelii TaxID=2765362 RepID=A0A939IWH7_9CORY|nr:riboflavin synthase [Corynebacterium mendelii]MBN9643430.1 riboflavin synthase [Corynebacterium mendelii]